MSIRAVRYVVFLKDTLTLSLTAFGGPQVLLAMMLERMVKKRGYIQEEELWELNALCSMLPGPSSTQLISAIGFRVGGPRLAYLTLLVWILPATIAMILAAILIHFLQENSPKALQFAKFIQPMAIGFLIFAAQKTITKMIKTPEAIVLMLLSAFVSFFYSSPYIFPVMLLLGGLSTSIKYKNQPKVVEDKSLHIKWSNFYLWGGVLVVAAVAGAITKSQPILLFENFYRNGSLIFGGGQVLIPYLYAEFVDLKQFLSSEEFLTGYALSQGIPGPTFSISTYIGALSMREFGLVGFVMGGLIATAGIFLPGIFLIFFVIRFWDQLKLYRPVRAALEGVNAVSCGMLIAGAYLLFEPLAPNFLHIVFILGTYSLLQFTKISSPIIVVGGILLGILLSLLLLVYRNSKPHFAFLGRIGTTNYFKNIHRFPDEVTSREDLVILRFDAQLFFGNFQYFKQLVNEAISKNPDVIKGFIINGRSINYIDSSAAEQLTDLISSLQKKGIRVMFVGAIGPARDVILKSNIIKVLKKQECKATTTTNSKSLIA